MKYFTCPNRCGKQFLEEVMSNVTTVASVWVDEDGELVYGEESCAGGEIDRFQCTNCGFVLRDEAGHVIQTPQALLAFLKRNKPDV